MSTEAANRMISIYTEMTPNPESMKFVLNEMLLSGNSVEFADLESAKESPLATELFGFPFIRGVFIMNNFVTLTKQTDIDWYDVIPSLRDFIKKYIESGSPVFTENFKAVTNNTVDAENDDSIVTRIKEMLENYVKPAVEMDGGYIQFKDFKEGTVSLILQGSCSGCPSSMVTLKSGIEGLLKRMVPEVKEVVAEAM